MLFGIGTAMHMADQRHIADEVRKQLVDNHAVGEALGQYCDMDGKLIYSTNNIGLSLPECSKGAKCHCCSRWTRGGERNIGVMRVARKVYSSLMSKPPKACVNCYKFLPYRRMSSYKF